jgi:hypothetical protein
MKIVSKSTFITLEHDIQIGDLSVTLVGQAWTDDKISYMDIDFTDVENIKYRGIPIDYDNWRKFKTFHKEMGIDYDGIMQKEFDIIFTKESITEKLQSFLS